MSKRQMNEASRYLLTLAKRNAWVYADNLKAKAIIVTGSVAEGMSDFYSDIDMIVYYDELPSEEDLQEAVQENSGSEHMPLGERTEGEFGESYLVHGVQCQIGHTTIAAWERDIATVMEGLDVTSPLQKSLSGMLEALPLYGEPLIRYWQAKIADYPDALAEAMVKHYLSFFPIWGLQERFAARDAILWLYQILVETEQNILGILSGLNRLYYSTFQFKRMHRFIEQMETVPPNLSTRLEAILRSDLTSAPIMLEDLIQDTVTLVEMHMPQIDTERVRQRIGWRQQAWELLTFAERAKHDR